MGKNKKTFKCINCEIESEKYASSFGRYCSPQCQGTRTFIHSVEKYLNGGYIGNKTLRKILHVLQGSFCSVCGIDKWCEKDIVLEVEHKDGNSNNNAIENLCLLCPNCHSQTSTYKGKNRGNGRHSRMLRYREGKSY
jgi:5-methylcytosine-specific restriction endonuclease McrA